MFMVIQWFDGRLGACAAEMPKADCERLEASAMGQPSRIMPERVHSAILPVSASRILRDITLYGRVKNV